MPKIENRKMAIRNTFLQVTIAIFALILLGGKDSTAEIRQSPTLFKYMSVSAIPSFDTDKVYAGYDVLNAKQQQTILRSIEDPALIFDVENYKALVKTTRIPIEKKFVRLIGYDMPADGGEGFFVIERKAPGQEADGVLVVETLAPNLVLKRLHAGSMNIKSAGAKGDGVTDDTYAIQRVLDTKMNIFADKDTNTFLVGFAKDSKKKSSPIRSALVIYSSQKINLRGSEFRLKSNSNSSILSNAALLYKEIARDSGIVIEQVKLDGNFVNQKVTNIGKSDQFSPTVYFANINGLRLRDVIVRNYYSAGIYITGSRGRVSRNIDMDKIVVDRGLGPGIWIKGEGFSIGEVVIENTKPFSENGVPMHYWGAHPNSMTANIVHSKIDSIRYKNCAWGFKLQDGSKDVRIERIIADGVTDGQAVKIQGLDDDRGYRPNQNVVVNTIISSNNNYNGLYVIYNKNVRIGKYVGSNNGLGLKYKRKPKLRNLDPKNFYDVLVIKSDVEIGEIDSSNNRVGVLFSHEEGERVSTVRRFDKVKSDVAFRCSR